jgi:predicted CXXCH cytochrome family protein
MDDAHKDKALPGLDEEQAAQVEEGVIKMANPAYETHTRPIVLFSHAGHYSNYGISCGQCHHDEQGRPLADLKEGAFVENCIACHSIPGEMPREQKTALQGLPEAQSQQKLLAFHAEAIHKMCTDCHRAWNQEQGKATREGAPTTCAQCHIRE